MIIPKEPISILGSDLTGSNATANRTYTLEDNSIKNSMIIVIENTILQIEKDFTFDDNTFIITFLNVVWDDQNITINYFIEDDVPNTFVSRDTLILTGADLTGSNSDTNRTFTLEDDSVFEGLVISVDNTILQPTYDFTFNKNTYLITFLNSIFDVSDIRIEYFIHRDANYTDTLNIVRVSGIGVEVSGENLGTGTGTESSFDTEYNNIIEDSFSLYYADTGSNRTLNLVLNTHYTINLDRGSILLTSLGLSLTNGKEIYMDYVYSPRHSNTLLRSFLNQIDKEVDVLTNDYYGSPITFTEYKDGFFTDYPSGDEPYSNKAVDKLPEFELKKQNINSITSIEYLDNTGSVSSTLETTQYRYLSNGRILINRTVPNGQANVKITYISGYDEVPILVKELASLIGGVKALVNISGGSYKDVSTYSIGRKSFSIGMIYVNVESSIKQMRSRIDEILGNIGFRYSCV